MREILMYIHSVGIIITVYYTLSYDIGRPAVCMKYSCINASSVSPF